MRLHQVQTDVIDIYSIQEKDRNNSGESSYMA